jgi:hypothetical protein
VSTGRISIPTADSASCCGDVETEGGQALEGVDFTLWSYILSKLLERFESEWALSWTWKWPYVSVVRSDCTSETYAL